jgi:hypothetical protein
MGWLRTLPAGTLNQWEAFDAVEPIGEQWEQTAQLSLLIRRMYELQLATAGGKPESMDFEDFFPARYRKKPVKKKKKDPKAMFTSLASLFGLKGVVK